MHTFTLTGGKWAASTPPHSFKALWEALIVLVFWAASKAVNLLVRVVKQYNLMQSLSSTDRDIDKH